MPSTRSGLIELACVAVAICAGVSSSTQSGVNSALALQVAGTIRGASTASVVVAATASFFGGLLLLILLNAAQTLWKRRRRDAIVVRRPRSVWDCGGGIIGCTIMLLNLLALPWVGFALVAVLAAAGRMLASLSMDHYGCAAAVRRVTRRRILGACLMLLGSFLAFSEHLGDSLRGQTPAAVLAVSLMPLAAGMLLPVQALVNSRLAQRLGAPLRKLPLPTECKSRTGTRRTAAATEIDPSYRPTDCKLCAYPSPGSPPSLSAQARRSSRFLAAS